jgi:hypothetical protein
MDTHTVWLIDVDGVINDNRAGWGSAGQSATAYADGRGYRLRWEPKVIAAIRTFNAIDGCEARWATTWCDHEPELRRVFGITLPVAFGPRPSHLTYDEQKVDAARAVLDAGQRLVWTDDTVVPPAVRMFPRFGRAEAEGRALLIAPRPPRGLRPDDVERIAAFAAAGASASTA